MCNPLFEIFKNESNIINFNLETDEEMFESDEESNDQYNLPLEPSQIYYRNMTINDFNSRKELFAEGIHNDIHVYGCYRKQAHSENRYCDTCLTLQYSSYEHHEIYDNADELNNDIESDIVGKQLNLLYGRMYCTFCDSFLFNVEFADEMNCEECKVQMDENDYEQSAITNRISYTFTVNE